MELGAPESAPVASAALLMSPPMSPHRPTHLAAVGPPWCRAAGVVLPGAGALSQQLVRVLHRPQLALQSRHLLPCQLLHALKLTDNPEGRGGEGGRGGEWAEGGILLKPWSCWVSSCVASGSMPWQRPSGMVIGGGGAGAGAGPIKPMTYAPCCAALLLARSSSYNNLARCSYTVTLP